MAHDLAQVEDAAQAIRSRWAEVPKVGIVLGTGMGELANLIETAATIPYQAIPGFPCPTALAHKGQLVCGTLASVNVVVMQGRCHLYEGYSIDEITLPIRVMRALGAEVLIVGNASGGMNPSFNSGDIVVMDSHVNLMWHTIAAAHLATAGDRAVRPPSPYDERLVQQALQIASRENFVAHRGVYVAVTGPSYETRAEYRCFRKIGGDVVGMSTVPEVIVGATLGMRVLGLSTVTNVAIPDAPQKTDAQEVVEAVERAARKLEKLVVGIVSEVHAVKS